MKPNSTGSCPEGLNPRRRWMNNIVCGQNCVAELTGQTLDEVVDQMGSGRTSGARLRRGLAPHRLTLGPRRGPDSRQPGRTYIARVHWFRPDGTEEDFTHWEVVRPGAPDPAWLRNGTGRYTSFYEVTRNP